MADNNKTSYLRELLNRFTKGNSKESFKQISERLEKERKEELIILQRKLYENYLKKLASINSDEMFSNGGIDYASILMSVLFNNTNSVARIYCKGFRRNLIMTDPYWTALIKYLENPSHILKVMVETDQYVQEEPLQLLQKIIQKRGEIGEDAKPTIEVRVITPKRRDEITQKYGEECNFAIFDDKKFRYEYDPENFRAYGSFNQPETCMKLKEVFETAFNEAKPLFRQL